MWTSTSIWASFMCDLPENIPKKEVERHEASLARAPRMPPPLPPSWGGTTAETRRTDTGCTSPGAHSATDAASTLSSPRSSAGACRLSTCTRDRTRATLQNCDERLECAAIMWERSGSRSSVPLAGRPADGWNPNMASGANWSGKRLGSPLGTRG